MPDTSERPIAPSIMVYAAGDTESTRAVMDAFTVESGITVLLTTESGRALIDRLSAEKHKATADLVIVDSIGHLWKATEHDILRPSTSQILETNIPERLRDSEKLWFALSASGRTIAYDKRETRPGELTNYVELGDDRWRGRLCLSSAANIQNQSHIAMMIGEHGVRPTEIIVRAWVENLAIPIVIDDAQLLQAIDDGTCALGIVDSDSLARYKRDRRTTAVAGFLPPTSSGGAYIDIVGAGVIRHASNPAGALQLLEWLSSENGRDLVKQDLKIPIGRLDEWNALQISPISLAGAGYHYEEAVKLMERARWR